MSFADLYSLTSKIADTLVYRQAEIDHIVEQFGQQESPFTADTAYIQQQLELNSKKIIEYTLHSVTLVEYLKVKRILRGLKLDICPTFFCNNKAFCDNWFKMLNHCSLE